MLVGHLQVVFGEMSLQVPFPLFDWVVCFSGIELYELLVYFGNSLSVVSFATIFSHYEGSLFTLLMASFAMQKLLSLIRSHLFTFVFISITLRVGHRGSCFDLCHQVFSLCFPLGVL